MLVKPTWPATASASDNSARPRLGEVLFVVGPLYLGTSGPASLGPEPVRPVLAVRTVPWRTLFVAVISTTDVLTWIVALMGLGLSVRLWLVAS